jgi:hypothetical protein
MSLLGIVGISIASGLVVASFNVIKINNPRKRMLGVLSACGVQTKSGDTTFFPKIVKFKKTEYGLMFIIRLPDGYDSNKIKDHHNAIKEAFGKEISMEFKKFLTIDVFDKEIPLEIDFVYEARNDYKILIGENHKQKFWLDLISDAPHYLIAGATRMGKSCLNRVILTIIALRGNVDLYLGDLKGGIELNLFKDLAITKSYATSVYKLDQTVTILVENMQMRLKKMNEKGIVNWKGRRIVFLLDELNPLLTFNGDEDRELKGKIKNNIILLASQGGACGISLFLCTQSPYATVIEGIVKANINNRLCFRVTDSDQSSIVLGKGNGAGAQLPTIRGRCLIYMNTKRDISQIYYLDYDKAKELLKSVERKPQHECEIPSNETNEVEEDSFILERSSVHDH